MVFSSRGTCRIRNKIDWLIFPVHQMSPLLYSNDFKFHPNLCPDPIQTLSSLLSTRLFPTPNLFLSKSFPSAKLLPGSPSWHPTSRHTWVLLLILLSTAPNWNKRYVMKCHHVWPHPSPLPSKYTHAHTLAWAPWKHLHQLCSSSYRNHPFPTLLIYKMKRSQCRFMGQLKWCSKGTQLTVQHRKEMMHELKRTWLCFKTLCAFYAVASEQRIAWLFWYKSNYQVRHKNKLTDTCQSN